MLVDQDQYARNVTVSIAPGTWLGETFGTRRSSAILLQNFRADFREALSPQETSINATARALSATCSYYDNEPLSFVTARHHF